MRCVKFDKVKRYSKTHMRNPETGRAYCGKETTPGMKLEGAWFSPTCARCRKAAGFDGRRPETKGPI